MKLHVGNLPKDTTDEQLRELAAAYGTVVSADVIKERSSGESRGYGFVVFETADAAKAAVAGMDGHDFRGQALKVADARAPKAPLTAPR